MKYVYKIMIIDDDQEILELLESALLKHVSLNLKINKYDSAEDGFSSCSKYKYDLIITDYKMPGMDGFSFIKTFRAFMGDVSTPIIFLSGFFRQLEAVSRASEFYNVIFYDKPFEGKKIANKVFLLLLGKKEASSILS